MYLPFEIVYYVSVYVLEVTLIENSSSAKYYVTAKCYFSFM